MTDEMNPPIQPAGDETGSAPEGAPAEAAALPVIAEGEAADGGHIDDADKPADAGRPADPDDAADAAEAAAVADLVAQKAVVPAAPAPLSLELHFLRHADAGDPMAWPGDDADRPLSKKGRGQAKRLGSLLSDLDVRVDAILTSPRLRSVDTARLVAKAVGVKAHVDDRLGIDFGEDTLASLVADLDENTRSVILVGHDPDFTNLVSWLVGASITMRKGALARVDLADRTVSAGRGSLRWLLPPDAVSG